MELKNSTILITGGTSGIGLEFIKQLQQHGVADIIVTGRDISKLEETKKQFPKIHTFQSDAGDPKDIENLFQKVVKQFPKLNIIINNAGIMRNMDLQDTSMDLENITSEIEINLSGTIRMVHQFLPHLKTKTTSAIINVSSGLAFVPFPASPVYSAAKSGVHAYTRILRLQLKNTRVKVFELMPPGTETPLMNAFKTDGNNHNMPVDKMVNIAIHGILKDKMEISPGLANMLKILSRVAPDFILSLFYKSYEKSKTK